MAAWRDIRSEQGYTLIELMAVVLIVGILGSMAVIQVNAVRPGLIADGAMRSVIAQVNYARSIAVAQRRQVVLECDTSSNTLRVVRRELPTGTTVLSQISFEGGIRYGLLPGAIDTPDRFGNSTPAQFTATTVLFSTEGALVDDSGAPANGSIFLLIPGVGGSYRAVTVLGATGRVRGYRWTGTQWTRV